MRRVADIVFLIAIAAPAGGPDQLTAGYVVPCAVILDQRGFTEKDLSIFHVVPAAVELDQRGVIADRSILHIVPDTVSLSSVVPSTTEKSGTA